MIQRIDHIAIAVHRLEDVIPTYEKMLGLPCERIEEVPSQKVRTAFFAVGEVHLELLEPTSDDSPLAKFLRERGEGLHHLAFASDDVPAQLALAKSQGARLINDTPVVGAGGKEVAFVHPHSVHGVLTEFCSMLRKM